MARYPDDPQEGEQEEIMGLLHQQQLLAAKLEALQSRQQNRHTPSQQHRQLHHTDSGSLPGSPGHLA
jgi:hypothetical protein